MYILNIHLGQLSAVLPRHYEHSASIRASEIWTSHSHSYYTVLEYTVLYYDILDAGLTKAGSALLRFLGSRLIIQEIPKY